MNTITDWQMIYVAKYHAHLTLDIRHPLPNLGVDKNFQINQSINSPILYLASKILLVRNDIVSFSYTCFIWNWDARWPPFWLWHGHLERRAVWKNMLCNLLTLSSWLAKASKISTILWEGVSSQSYIASALCILTLPFLGKMNCKRLFEDLEFVFFYGIW